MADEGNKAPILFLTARDTVPDVVQGLDIDPDGYMTKPFSFEKFLVRLRSVARRGPIPLLPRLHVGDRVQDLRTHEDKRSGEENPLHRRK
jgi:two-component system, OmpR family, copper resistance phosphate regulon response regulator CusR